MNDWPYSIIRLFVILFGSLTIWLLQINAGEILATLYCGPDGNPLDQPLAIMLLGGLWGITGIALAGGLGCFYLSFITWRELRANNAPAIPMFFVNTGILASSVFTTAILFTSFAVLLVSPCTQWGL